MSSHATATCAASILCQIVYGCRREPEGSCRHGAQGWPDVIHCAAPGGAKDNDQPCCSIRSRTWAELTGVHAGLAPKGGPVRYIVADQAQPAPSCNNSKHAAGGCP